MKISVLDPPRNYKVHDIKITQCADIILEPDEQVTFKTESGTEYDITRKSWGYYATPSINERLVNHGLRGVLVKNKDDHQYLLLIERGKEQSFFDYLLKEKMKVIFWFETIA